MNDKSKQTVVDTKEANVTGEHSNDKVILLGAYPYEDSNYLDNVELVLNRENSEPISIKFPYSGYNIQLFTADFTGDKKSEIMVRGGYGGSGGFEIGVIYTYENGTLVDIFNHENFNNSNPCTSKFKDNYKVSVNCGKSKYLIDISKRPKDYLDSIYTPNKTVNTSINPYVDAPIGIYPIKEIYNSYYELLIEQRIVGTVNFDTIGVIQTVIDILNSKLNILSKGVFLSSYDERKKYK
ncbi:hypothetical protein [Romboutsia lituseburensis]|uniref:hypothetical protein n=1 Tax=Romboutsia lituseburensis TaxID=1537 RepID=UPI00215A71B9|nr:hypothetical protein [Romboutsia lituseburensis]MCR8747001.1 hypothetical protein [Romboutsia lituseburensis]